MERCELTLRVPRANETSTTINSTLVLGDGLNRVGRGDGSNGFSGGDAEDLPVEVGVYDHNGAFAIVEVAAALVKDSAVVCAA